MRELELESFKVSEGDGAMPDTTVNDHPDRMDSSILTIIAYFAEAAGRFLPMQASTSSGATVNVQDSRGGEYQ
jgi:hypothetical protein